MATLVLGGRFERALVPVLMVIGTNFAGFGALVGYFGIWLIKARHADVETVSTALFLAGLAGAVGAGTAGSAVDRLGPQRMIIGIAALHTIGTAVLVFPVGTWTGIGAVVMVTGTQPLRGVAQRTLIGALSRQGSGEKAFADLRLVLNLGMFCGPLVGAGLLHWGWQSLRVGVFLLYALSLVTAVKLYSARLPDEMTAPAARSRPVASSPMSREHWRLLLLLLVGSSSAWIIMYLYEAVIPILVVGTQVMSASEWGFVYSVGPLLFLVGQFRIQRWFRSFAPLGRLLGGVSLMGFAFLIFWDGLGTATLLLFIVIFVFGDMLWGPGSEDLVIRAAPKGRTGAYVGAVTSTMWIGNAVAPAAGLYARERYGDHVLWLGAAGLGLLGALCYAKVYQLVSTAEPVE